MGGKLSFGLQPSGYGHAAPREVFNVRIVLAAIVAAFSGFCFGYDMGFIGTTVSLESLRSDLGVAGQSEADQQFFATNVVSFFQAGCVVGCLIVGPLSSYIGRRWMTFGFACLFVLGSTLQFVCLGETGIRLLYSGRILGGIAVGGASAITPVYLAEVSPTEIRGSMVGIYEVGVQLGTTLGFWIIYAVKKTLPDATVQWRFPVAFQLVPGGILALGMLFLPETPRWTAIHQSREKALQLLSKIRNLDADHPYIAWEMQGINDQVDMLEQRRMHTGKRHSYFAAYKELAAPGIRNRLLCGVLLMIFFQMSGTNAINYYSPIIFKSLGFQGSTNQFLATGIYGVVRLACILVAMLFVVDRVGRRTLIMIGAVGMGLCMWYIGAYLHVKEVAIQDGDRPSSAYSAIVFIYVYAAFFCFSFAGIPWIYNAEIFPAHLRTYCTSITSATHWLFNLMLARSVPYMFSGIGPSTYFVFASCLTVAFFWAYFLMPETRNLSLEDMDMLWTQPEPPPLFVRADRFRRSDLLRGPAVAAVELPSDMSRLERQSSTSSKDVLKTTPRDGTIKSADDVA